MLEICDTISHFNKFQSLPTFRYFLILNGWYKLVVKFDVLTKQIGSNSPILPIIQEIMD